MTTTYVLQLEKEVFAALALLLKKAILTVGPIPFLSVFPDPNTIE